AQVGGDSLPCAHGGARASRAERRMGSASDESPSDVECDGLAPEEGEQDCHQTGTTAFAVADADGNVVAATQTLGTWGGSFYITPGLGFLYNDKVTSYGRDASAFGSR